MGAENFAQETRVHSQAVGVLTQLEVELLADKITAEIFTFDQKSAFKKKLIEIVASELEKIGVLNKGDASLGGVCLRSCIQDL